MERKGYKVTNQDMKCRDFQFEIGKQYVHEGDIKMCGSGFHFCQQVNNCFNYYVFNSSNRVFEIEYGANVQHGDDKSVTDTITLVRELTWQEVLVLVNTGENNTGRSNSGDGNSGYRNSGDRNSGYGNSGYGNSGNRNSGDANSGYRNSGAFCTDQNPRLVLFDKPTTIFIKDWENSEVVQLMRKLEPTIWVAYSSMTPQEKQENSNAEICDGYLKTLTYKEMWANFWNDLQDDQKALFTSLPNFDADKFEEITGIKTL